MNVFALIFLITSWICFFLGSSVFFQDTRNTLNRLFMLLSVVASYLAFMEFGNLQAQNPNIALMALKLTGLWPIGVALLLHFVLVTTEKSKLLKNKLLYLLIYGPALAFSILQLTTGLGLSICYGIIQQHNGHIYARSKFGEGSTFVVEIPIISDGQPALEKYSLIKARRM
jgi:hypothetical protein